MTCQSFSSNYKSTQPLLSLCDRLKQRYENNQKDWQSLFQDQIQEKNVRDIEFIRYIVNFIIEQAKYNIVISELPDVIRTLHCEAEAIIRKNRMITLEEAIAQVQTAGAIKYPYLKKVKPISAKDFVKEVMHEVFNRLGTIITLDRIENICRFTTCSAKQLLHTMPEIDVNEASTLITEDILRNQHKIDKNQKQTDISMLLSSSLMNRQAYSKPEGTPSSVNKEMMRSERASSKSIQNSNQSYSKTRLAEYRDSPKTSHRSSKNSNEINSTEQKSNSHFAHIPTENPFMEARRRKSIKEPESTNASSSIFVPFDTGSMKESPLVEIEHKEISIVQPTVLKAKAKRNTRKSSSVHEQAKDQNEEIIDPLTDLTNQTIKLSRSKSNTQSYSIHSEEGLPTETQRPATTSVSNINGNAVPTMFIKPTKSPHKIFVNLTNETLLHTTPFTNNASCSNTASHSKDRPFIIEALQSPDLKEIKSRSKILPSIRHYSKYCYQHSDISDNEEQITDMDTEYCPLEAILHDRFRQQTDYITDQPTKHQDSSVLSE